MDTVPICFAVLWLLMLLASAHDDKANGVTYDGTSLIINGKRELLFSGSIHYPRSTPEMWPDLMRKAKAGGLNVIQTYVFWNVHEPTEGEWNFHGNNDLVKFIKLIQENGMYVTLRVGPFIQAEWNHGGIPYWLREKKNITFRTNNEPFKFYMEKYVRKVIQMMKDEKLFAPQGGPIILAQIENEYNSVQRAFKEEGMRYVQWAGKMAVSTDAGVPWIMCKQNEAPDPIINACNGRHCGDTWPGPNKPYKPSLWTENWTAQFRVWGDPPSQRAAEDLAYSIVRFFSKNGTLVNYYMYHGGTNFGRTSSVFSTTRYYDEAPLDEYGLQREPKWTHLKDAQKALRLCKPALLAGAPKVTKINEELEIRYYKVPGSKTCSAFLTNNNTKIAQDIKFRGRTYSVAPRSISVLPDCKTVVFNTDLIVSQHNSRNYVPSKNVHNLKWEISTEEVPDTNKVPVDSTEPKELYSLNKDTTDYAWYTTNLQVDPIDLPFKKNVKPILRVANLGHAMLAFVNGKYVGTAHGSHVEKTFVFQQPIDLKVGHNDIAFLCMTVGLQDSGSYMERTFAGPHVVTLLGLNTGTLDLTNNGWGHKVGLEGEKVRAYTQGGSHRVDWTELKGPGPPVSWYKTYFHPPEGNDPVVIRLPNMSKGMVWINGKSIGRYWNTFLSPLLQPTQSEYHIPRAYMKPSDNLMVVFDESGGNPETIEMLTVNRDTICSFVGENYPPNVDSWDMKKKTFTTVVDNPRPTASLECPNHKRIVAIEFASFGDPVGFCGDYELGKCNSAVSKQVVEKHCLGKESCEVPIDKGLFDEHGDGCPNIVKTLAIQAKCSF